MSFAEDWPRALRSAPRTCHLSGARSTFTRECIYPRCARESEWCWSGFWFFSPAWATGITYVQYNGLRTLVEKHVLLVGVELVGIMGTVWVWHGISEVFGERFFTGKST